ncbi:MAG: glycine cleavage system protein T [Ignavibacteriales bacterium]
MKQKEIAEIIQETFGLQPVFDGERVRWYENTMKEYEALHTGVGMRFLAQIYILKLSGGDALDFLNRISTNNLKDLAVNQTRKTIFTTDKGRILDSVLILRQENNLLVLGALPKKDVVTAWISRFIITDDVHIEDMTDILSLLEISGGQLSSFATLLLGPSYSTQQPDTQQKYDNVFEGLSVLNHRGKNNREAVLLLFEHSLLADLLAHLQAIKVLFDFSFIGYDAAELYRVEQGIPEAGELTDEFNPHEVNLIHEVSFTKGCYIGQEVIARLDSYDKVQKLLTGVVMENSFPVKLPAVIVDDDNKEVGKITSAVKDPKSGYKGLAVIRKAYLSGEKDIYILDDGKQHPVKIHSLPFRKLV